MAESAAVLQATSQVTRFHIQEHADRARDVDLHQVTVTIGDNEVLSDAHLQLMQGVHYGLLGRNGVGKSCLMRAIGEGQMVGWPRAVRVVYVAQEAAGEERSALEVVASSDPHKARLESELELLEGAQASGDPDALVQAVVEVRAAAAETSAYNAEMYAAKRSGERGMIATKAAVAARQQARAAAAVAAAGPAAAAAASNLDASAAEEEVARMIAARYEALAEEDADADEARAGEILAGLGFSNERQRLPTSALSGGWRMRVALAIALFSEPDLLLLDEPTNHLDIQSALWLQEWLVAARGRMGVLVVSHDRSFLNAVAQETVLYKDKKLTYYSGNYDSFQEARAMAALTVGRQVELQGKREAKLKETIATMTERAGKAKAGSDDKRLAQVASRRKKLEERLGGDRLPDGTRFKLSQHRYLCTGDQRRPMVQLEAPEKPPRLELPPPDDLHYSGPLLQLREVTFSYPPSSSGRTGAPSTAIAAAPAAAAPAAASRGVTALRPASGGKVKVIGKVSSSASSSNRGSASGTSAAATALPTSNGPPPVLSHVSLDVGCSSRIGLIGANGGGKSTLMKLLLGQLSPTTGTLERFGRLKVALYSQHHVETLQLPESPLQRLQVLYPALRDQEARDYLGNFGLGGGEAVRPLSALSGGQKSRMALALAMAGHPHILLLDEPTNHLDIATILALVKALDSWQGGVVVSSHDVRFLDEVCRSGTVGEDGLPGGQLYEVGSCGITRVKSAAAYAQKVLTRVRKQQERAAAAAAAAAARRGR